MTFTVKVPVQHHEAVSNVLHTLTDHVAMNADKRSGKSKNSDGTEIEFSVVPSDQIQITVTANPHNLSEHEIKGKAEKRIKELIAGK